MEPSFHSYINRGYFTAVTDQHIQVGPISRIEPVVEMPDHNAFLPLLNRRQIELKHRDTSVGCTGLKVCVLYVWQSTVLAGA